ncbi:MAG: cell envelope integrity EipB family protein [Alphaproteobacteria bacterium]|nr:cell envelope integrity EipB family protein [Alphaproteobacteria bacterium]
MSVFFMLTGGVWADTPVDPAIQDGLTPHKALYKIGLVSTKSGSQILNIDGQMYYQWQPGCDGWTSDNRFKILYEYADSEPMAVESDFSTFETYDGKSLSFTSQRKRDGEVFEEMRGQALLDKEDGSGAADFSIPEGLSFALSSGTLFPMQHTRAVLKEMKAGKKFYSSTIFDGSDEEGPVEVNAFIGKKIDGADGFTQSDDLDISLLQGNANKVRLAFFPLSNPESTADYEMDVVFHENGIISHMEIHYEDFSLSQQLIALEKQENNCKTDEKATKAKPED